MSSISGKGWIYRDQCCEFRSPVLRAKLRFRIFAAILLLILSLTLGASYGWATAYFLVPLILSVFLFPAFFYWESRLPATHALIPPVTWTYPNFPLWVALNIFSYAWWTCCQIPVIEVFTEIRGDLPIIAAIRVLPSGIFSLFSSILLVYVCHKLQLAEMLTC